MAYLGPVRAPYSHHLPSPVVPVVLFVTAVVVPAAVCLLLLPHRIVLPVLSVVWLACAAISALFACLEKGSWNARTLNAWDAAGAFTMIACAAAMLSEPENVIDLLK